MNRDLATLVASLKDAHVGCVGDVMLDRFMYGSVERISPEAPVPVLRVVRESVSIGGAGNVVSNLVALGALVQFVSVIGEDEAGATVRGLLTSSPGTSAHLLTDGRPTTLKTRFVGGHQQILRVDQESTRPVPGELEDRIVAAIGQMLSNCRALVLSDYAKGLLTERVCSEAIALARTAGVPVIVDPKQRDFSRYRFATLVTPNRKELQEATGMPVASDADIEVAARSLIQRFDLGAILVTRSEEGLSLIEREGKATHLPAIAREVFDVSGAGDTAIAVLAAASAVAIEPTLAARLANAAAGVAVAKTGTATVTAEELHGELLRIDSEYRERKLLSAREASELFAKWRLRSQRIAFTNGCFDLLHPGHVQLLREARASADHLVVGLNSDESVRRLKGPDRPIQNEAARATVLAALADVDAVVLFDEDTPLQLIKQLLPDVLIKGSDYRVDQVVGADVVQAAGGVVKLVELVPAQSTTRMVERMGRTAP